MCTFYNFDSILCSISYNFLIYINNYIWENKFNFGLYKLKYLVHHTYDGHQLYRDTHIKAAASTHSVYIVGRSIWMCMQRAPMKCPHIYQHILTSTCLLPSRTSSEVEHPPPSHRQTVTSSAIKWLHLLSNPSKARPLRNSSLHRKEQK